MKGGSIIEYVIRAWDKTKEALSSALSHLRSFKSESKKVVEEAEENSKRADGAVERVFRSAGRLPGVFGRVQTALGRFGGTAAAVIGAFKIGWDIGTWINEKVITPLFDIKDPIEELKKKNRELRQEFERAFKAFGERMEEWEAHWDKEIRNTDRARENIEDMTETALDPIAELLKKMI